MWQHQKRESLTLNWVQQLQSFEYFNIFLQEVDNLYLTIFELQTSITSIEDQIIFSKQIYEAVSINVTAKVFFSALLC